MPDAGYTNNPEKTDKHGNAKNVLDCWQVDAQHDAEISLNRTVNTHVQRRPSRGRNELGTIPSSCCWLPAPSAPA